MKTHTEFSSFSLKNAIAAADQLTAGGKTAEELPAALGEQLKLEGDKLKWMMGAIETARGLKGNLKRILVIGLNEGEAAPSGAVAMEGFHLLAEYFPSAPQQQPRVGKDRDERGGRSGKGKGRGKGKGGRGGRGESRDAGGRGGERRGGEGRGPRRPRGDAEGQALDRPAGGPPPALPKPRPTSDEPAPQG